MALPFEEEVDPALQDWQLMAPDAPISSALRPSQPELPPEPQEPRKLLDVSRGAPAQSQPRQDGGGIDALKEAMAQARQNRMGAELGMAGQTIANAFVPQKSSGFWERQLEGADRPVQELQAFEKRQGEAETRDLNRRRVAADEFGKQAYAERLRQEGEKLKAKDLKDAEVERAKNDPTHPSQVAGRERWRKAFPDLAATLGDSFETSTMGQLGDMQTFLTKAAQANKTLDPQSYQGQSLKLRERELWLAEQRRKQDALDKQQKAEDDKAYKRKQKEADRAYDEAQVAAKADAKRKEAVTEVDNYGENIQRNLEKLDKMVQQEGTVSFTGPEAEIMGATVKEIAVDAAKMADPGSVARDSDIKLEQSKLWDPQSFKSGMSLTNKTARALIADYKQRAKDRLATAYKVRGIGQRQTTLPTPNVSGAAAPAGKPERRTPNGNPFTRATMDQAAGRIRYYDEKGEVQ